MNHHAYDFWRLDNGENDQVDCCYDCGKELCSSEYHFREQLEHKCVADCAGMMEINQLSDEIYSDDSPEAKEMKDLISDWAENIVCS